MNSSTLAQQLPHIATARPGSGRSVPCLGNVASQMWCTEANSPSLHLPQDSRTTTTTDNNNNHRLTLDAQSISRRGMESIREQLG